MLEVLCWHRELTPQGEASPGEKPLAGTGAQVECKRDADSRGQRGLAEGCTGVLSGLTDAPPSSWMLAIMPISGGAWDSQGLNSLKSWNPKGRCGAQLQRALVAWLLPASASSPARSRWVWQKACG